MQEPHIFTHINFFKHLNIKSANGLLSTHMSVVTVVIQMMNFSTGQQGFYDNMLL